MARGINKVILVGNLGADPETRYMPSGGAVTNIRIATSESWKDKNTGEQQERTEWHNIAFFGRLAEIAGEYLSKGRQVLIEGRLQMDQWEDRETGQKRSKLKVVGESMQLLGGRGDGPPRGGGGDAPQRQAPAGQAPPGPDPAASFYESPPSSVPTDDVPF